MHPYMALAVTHERIADYLRVAEANQRARGAKPATTRPRSWRRRHDQARAAALCEAGC